MPTGACAMTSDVPAICPFCDVAAGRETQADALSDVVFRDELTTAFVSPKWWEADPGHVIVVPNEHVPDHVFPRRAGDRLYERNEETRWAAAEERAPVAERLRSVLY